MDDLEQKTGETMSINSKLKEAALAVVRGEGVKDNPVPLTGYPGMLVAKTGHPDLQEMYFFEDNGIRYAIGPTKK